MAIEDNEGSESENSSTEESPSETDGESSTSESQSSRSLFESDDDTLDSVAEDTDSPKAYDWEDFKEEYFYNADGSVPTQGGQSKEFDASEYLGFAPEETPGVLSNGQNIGDHLHQIVEDRTVDVNERIDEDDFFTTADGHTTLVNRYDLEKAVSLKSKLHFEEIERYWVNKPYAFVIIFHSQRENERKYFVIESHLNEIEQNLKEFLSQKLRMAIKYSDQEVQVGGSEAERRQIIENETRKLLDRYDIFEEQSAGIFERLGSIFGSPEEDEVETGQLEGIQARPEPIILTEDADTLSEYQVEKLLYYLTRDFIGYERIDGIKNDINVEDISCDGYNSRVFVYHVNYESIITNISHGGESLDDFVVKLAQRSGKGISKRRPQVDARLPDGSRAQLTLGHEVSDHGTNYTIRQFKDVPFTPVDLINWNTFSLDEMAFMWLCIENNKSMLFAGGTASGKTTALNAVSLFIPSKSKIVSIEDTREVKLPQRNWVASVTRPSFAEDGKGDVDEFDLLEAALRQRPEYIVFGEVRGEEGRTLFQVMSTGHTTYTTFHADSVAEVLRRFTTDPINVSKTMFTALDLVAVQTQTRVQGQKVRRNKVLTEINHYDTDNDEINVQDLYQWQAETDDYLQLGTPNTLQELRFDRGWTQQEIDHELFRRQVVLSYLIDNGLKDYAQVAATLQAFINDPEATLTLMANDQLEESLEELRDMESVEINVAAEQEEMFPRPDPSEELQAQVDDLLDDAQDQIFEERIGKSPESLTSSIGALDETADDVVVTADQPSESAVEAGNEGELEGA